MALIIVGGVGPCCRMAGTPTGFRYLGQAGFLEEYLLQWEAVCATLRRFGSRGIFAACSAGDMDG
jgi:hypothetical protein